MPFWNHIFATTIVEKPILALRDRSFCSRNCKHKFTESQKINHKAAKSCIRLSLVILKILKIHSLLPRFAGSETIRLPRRQRYGYSHTKKQLMLIVPQAMSLEFR